MGTGKSGLSNSGGGGGKSNQTKIFNNAYSDIMSGNATADSLAGLKLSIDKAVFTANGNSVQAQVASISNNGDRIDLIFNTAYDPRQVGAPTRAIKTSIEARLWKSGNVVAVRSIENKSTKSLKNAKNQYDDLLGKWKKITGQQTISF